MILPWPSQSPSFFASPASLATPFPFLAGFAFWAYPFNVKVPWDTVTGSPFSSLSDVIHFHGFRHHPKSFSPGQTPFLRASLSPTASWASPHRHLRVILLNTELPTLSSKLLFFQSFQARKLGIISHSSPSTLHIRSPSNQVLLIPPYENPFSQPSLCYSASQSHYHLSSGSLLTSHLFSLLNYFPCSSQNFTIVALSLYTRISQFPKKCFLCSLDKVLIP